MSTAMIYTGSVEVGPVIDPSALSKLATALCDDGWHDYRVSDGDFLSIEDDERFEAEVKTNGGYCNRCMDDAGFILSKFDLTEREDAR